MRQYSPLIAGAALAAAVTLAGPARALTFSNDFTDPSWSQSSTILNEMETAVPAAEHVLDGLFSNPVNISLYFVYNPSAGGAYTEFNNNNYPAPYGPGGLNLAAIEADLTATRFSIRITRRWRAWSRTCRAPRPTAQTALPTRASSFCPMRRAWR